MSVYIDQWRAVTGMFYANLSCISIKRYIRRTKLYDNSFLFLFFFVLILSLKHDDIEINPGPNKKYQNVFHVVTGM